MIAPASAGSKIKTHREAAEWLRISERKLYSLAKNGDIRRVVMGKAVRYRQEELERFAQENER